MAASRAGPQVGLRLVGRGLTIAEAVRLGRRRLENAVSRVVVGPGGLTVASETSVLRPYNTTLEVFGLPLSSI